VLPGAVSADPVTKKLSLLGYLGFQAVNPRSARPKFNLLKIVIRIRIGPEFRNGLKTHCHPAHPPD